MVSTGPRSTTKVVFLKSSIFIPLTSNLKRIYIWSFNSTRQLFLRSNLFSGFCKYRALHDVIILPLAKSRIFQVHWSVDFVITCEKKNFFASMLVCLFVQTFVCLFVCLFVASLEPTVLIGTI